MKIFSVLDAKSEAYLNPFYARTTAEALRMFADASNDTKHDFYRFASDFTLVELGDFDQLTGRITVLDVPKSLGLASEYKGTMTD